MAKDISHLQLSQLTPKKVLVVFCMINMITYMDQGMIASSIVNKAIRDDLKMTKFENGVLSTAFSVGILLGSPLFASMANSVNTFRLIGIGLSTWCFSVAGCGLSYSFVSITLCRVLVGTGEASFMSLAAPFINENAPSAQKTLWLGIFYFCIPAGVALGHVYGGIVGKLLGWRSAFFGVSIAMVPFALLGFLMNPTHLKDFAPISRRKLTSIGTYILEVKDDVAMDVSKVAMNDISIHKRFLGDVKVLFLEKAYVVNILGYILYNFVIGAYSYWAPKVGYNVYKMNDSDVVFGGITVVCGMVGTVAGGYVLDLMSSTISNAFKLLSTAAFLGAIFFFSAFCSENVYCFLVLFSIGELLVFSMQGPVNLISLHCVKPSLRPMSLAMSIVAIQISGFVPSSQVIEILKDYTKNWRITALILTSVLFLAASTWFLGIYVHKTDKFMEDPDEIIDKCIKTPLIEEKAEKVETACEP
ncbi:probable sphingolipid transporter spinster homolog 2 [Impatiens glandulifera]|uniref:probable sphingolipid transporter spinster homolog 2 n=1 Tax=Impatiens glandulifera TaxID=253017 RepID=UPI001FB04D3E|nr:probable sphingolipid transporter spinster homolog 2 [Impatiens glandulifera]